MSCWRFAYPLVAFGLFLVAVGCGVEQPENSAETPQTPSTSGSDSTAKADVPEAEIAWGEMQEGLRLGISTDQKQYVPGTKVAMTVWLENASDEAVNCVLPSASETSDFPLLLAFGIKRTVHHRELDYSKSGKFFVAEPPNPPKMHPGAGQFSPAHPGQRYAATFSVDTGTLASAADHSDGLQYGDYELRVSYFVRASTPIGTDLNTPNASRILAGIHLYSGNTRFVFTGNLPGGELSLGEALSRPETFVFAGKAGTPGQNNRDSPWTTSGYIDQPLFGPVPDESHAIVDFDLAISERPPDRGERLIWICEGRGPSRYVLLKVLPDTPENRKAVGDAATSP